MFETMLEDIRLDISPVMSDFEFYRQRYPEPMRVIRATRDIPSRCGHTVPSAFYKVIPAKCINSQPTIITALVSLNKLIKGVGVFGIGSPCVDCGGQALEYPHDTWAWKPWTPMGDYVVTPKRFATVMGVN